MNKIVKGNYSIEVIDKDNINDLREVQRLRYKFLVNEYNSEVEEDGIDDDGFDETSDILVVRDIEKQKIVATYRFTSPKTNPLNLPYMVDRQYDIEALKESGELFIVVSRACVHKDYRDGVVIKLLLEGLFAYCESENASIFLGLCSFHGTDINQYANAFTYLYNEKKYDAYKLTSTMHPFSLDMLNGKYNPQEAKSEMPSLLKMYIQIGALICPYGTIDYDFNSIDVMLVVDIHNINKRMCDFLLR